MHTSRALIPLAIAALLLVTGCTTSPPKNTNNICSIFKEKKGWYDDARDASKRWGSPIPVMMAIMHQESKFVADAKPPRTRILWIFPGPRKSDAYGYAQAKDATWDWYKDKGGRWGADRDDFGDAIDFIGWYNYQSRKRLGLAVVDTYNLYLAYHEGHGGFERQTFKKKAWLLKVASAVNRRAAMYTDQLNGCEAKLKKKGFLWW